MDAGRPHSRGRESERARLGNARAPPTSRIDRELLRDLRNFAASRSKEDLHREGQRRSIAIAPVNSVNDVLEDRQLAARGSSLRRPIQTRERASASQDRPSGFRPLAGRRRFSRRNRLLGGRQRPRDRVTMRTALQGIRVLDFCWVGAGALVTKLLAEHGADVIKVESRARPDNLRVAPPFPRGLRSLDASGYFASRNNDKRSLALDMRQPISREFARELAGKCDLVTNNFRPGVMEGWGLDYETLRADNPSLLYLSMPMSGSTGPDQTPSASDPRSLHRLAWFTCRDAQTGPRSGPALTIPTTFRAQATRLVAVLAALLQRDKTGAGRMIEISQLESTVNTIGPADHRRIAGRAADTERQPCSRPSSEWGLSVCRQRPVDRDRSPKRPGVAGTSEFALTGTGARPELPHGSICGLRPRMSWRAASRHSPASASATASLHTSRRTEFPRGPLSPARTS